MWYLGGDTTERCCHVYTRELHKNSVNVGKNNLKGLAIALPLERLTEKQVDNNYTPNMRDVKVNHCVNPSRHDRQ